MRHRTCKQRFAASARGLLRLFDRRNPYVEHVNAKILLLPHGQHRSEIFTRSHGQGLVPFRSCTSTCKQRFAFSAALETPRISRDWRARVVCFCAPARVKRRFYVHRAKGFFPPSEKFLPFAAKTRPMHAFSNRAGAWRRKCQKLPWRIKYPFAEHTLNANAREIFRAIRAGEVFAKGCFECR